MNRQRWKDVERGVAREFTTILSGVGNSPMERIPLLGREGPDLTVNETGLVVNVKSRLKIPERLMAPERTLVHIGDLVGFRLCDILQLRSRNMGTHTERPWKQLLDWHTHMDKWTKEFKPDGISCIVLHRPKMPYGIATVVIHINDFWRLKCQQTTPTRA